MDINKYFEALRSRRCDVLGLGVSNLPLARRLLASGAQVTIRDRAVPAAAEEMRRLGAKLVCGENYLDDISGEFIFRSPGIRPDAGGIPAAVAGGAVLTGEMEAFFEVCPCPIIAVTGSDGKTTTSTLISELLKRAGYTVWLGGNIGNPLLCEADRIAPGDVAVLELSSFQLMTMKKSPSIAVITNLSPNHLDWHTDVNEYYAAKENVFLHQDETGLLVLNAANDITLSMAPKAKGGVKLFGGFADTPWGVFEHGGELYSATADGVRSILKISDILIPGHHNVENYMAAICAVESLVSADDIRSVASSFGGVEHRIELVRIKDGVKYYNDSIASSPSRAIAALKSFDKKVILIAGGKDKGIPFDALAPYIAEKVKLLVLTGATAETIRAAAEKDAGCPPIIMEPDFDLAVKAASDAAQSGDVVILSPACTSFDRFKNFAERGVHFKEVVNAL